MVVYRSIIFILLIFFIRFQWHSELGNVLRSIKHCGICVNLEDIFLLQIISSVGVNFSNNFYLSVPFPITKIIHLQGPKCQSYRKK